MTAEEYEAIYGPGGARHPVSGERLVSTRRPGLELVISAHKSVAELGVIGRAEDMHRSWTPSATPPWPTWTGSPARWAAGAGEAAVATATGGLIYAHTRHATSRAGDPCPHDHVLVANLVEMARRAGRLEGGRHRLVARAPARRHHGRPGGRRPGGGRAGLWDRGRPGPVGKLGHWRIAGVPDEVMEVHSKRAAEIDAECARRGETSYQARGVAARDHPPGQRRTRRRGRSGGPVARRAGRRSAGRSSAWPPSIDAAAAERAGPAARPCAQARADPVRDPGTGR